MQFYFDVFAERLIFELKLMFLYSRHNILSCSMVEFLSCLIGFAIEFLGPML